MPEKNQAYKYDRTNSSHGIQASNTINDKKCLVAPSESNENHCRVEGDIGNVKVTISVWNRFSTYIKEKQLKRKLPGSKEVVRDLYNKTRMN